MKAFKALAVILSIVGALGLTACGTTGGGGGYQGAIPSGAIPNGNGTITEIVPVRANDDLFRFTIRMNNGSIQTLRHEGRAGFRVGDHVRIRGGMMERM